MLLIIWILDFIYGKKFKKNSPAVVAQHMITTYIILSCAFAMNNIIIKHKYRTERHKKDDDFVENNNVEYVNEDTHISII